MVQAIAAINSQPGANTVDDRDINKDKDPRKAFFKILNNADNKDIKSDDEPAPTTPAPRPHKTK
jgi:hypothetical protein